MLDQKIVEEASAEWLLSEKGSEDPFIAGARWMEKYLEENKKSCLAPLVPRRISCGGY